MDTLTIRQKLHYYINDVDDENLMKELDRRYNDLKSGKDKGMTLDEATTHLLNRLK